MDQAVRSDFLRSLATRGTQDQAKEPGVPLGHRADPVHAGEGGNTCRKAAAETTDKGYKPGKRKFSLLFKTTWVFPLDLAAEQHRCSEWWEGVRAAPFWCAVVLGCRVTPAQHHRASAKGRGPAPRPHPSVRHLSELLNRLEPRENRSLDGC